MSTSGQANVQKETGNYQREVGVYTKFNAETQFNDDAEFTEHVSFQGSVGFTDPVTFTANVGFQDNVSFTDTVNFGNTVNFSDPVDFQDTTTFNGTSNFTQHVAFQDTVNFNDPVDFGDPVAFQDPVNFNDNAIFNSNITMENATLASLTQVDSWSDGGLWSDNVTMHLVKIAQLVFCTLIWPEDGVASGGSRWKSPNNVLPVDYRPAADHNWVIVGHNDTSTHLVMHYETSGHYFEVGRPQVDVSADPADLDFGPSQVERTGPFIWFTHY